MKNNLDKKQSSKFILFDAKGKILGRLATEIARALSGKNEINFEPRLGGKDWVVVINSDQIRLSGDKEDKKFIGDIPVFQEVFTILLLRNY